MQPRGESLFSLTGKSILVTGAYGYLGRAMVSDLARAGAHVFVNGRSPEKCLAMAEEVRELGFLASAAAFDVTDDEQVARFFEDLDGAPLDGLVNNAFSGRGGTVETLTETAYGEAYEVTVTAAHRLIRAGLPNLRQAAAQSGYASVVNVASMYGLVSPVHRNYGHPDQTNPPSYGAAKAGLIQFTRYAACEFGHESVRINALAPGPFPSDVVRGADPGFVDRLALSVPMRRVGDAQELSGPVIFLLSEASSFVNGAILSVDGGWTSW